MGATAATAEPCSSSSASASSAAAPDFLGDMAPLKDMFKKEFGDDAAMEKMLFGESGLLGNFEGMLKDSAVPASSLGGGKSSGSEQRSKKAPAGFAKGFLGGSKAG